MSFCASATSTGSSTALTIHPSHSFSTACDSDARRSRQRAREVITNVQAEEATQRTRLRLVHEQERAFVAQATDELVEHRLERLARDRRVRDRFVSDVPHRRELAALLLLPRPARDSVDAAGTHADATAPARAQSERVGVAQIR